MEELKQRILKDGKAKKEGNVVLVSSFLNDQLDPERCIIDLCRQSGAQIAGMGFLVEKEFAKGGQFLRDHGIQYHALATIQQINDDNTMEVEG